MAFIMLSLLRSMLDKMESSSYFKLLDSTGCDALKADSG